MPMKSKNLNRKGRGLSSKRKVKKIKHFTTARKKKQNGLQNLNEVDAGEIDFETLVKEEFMRLHRQYRLMEDARRLIAGKGNNLSKKGQFLELLRTEREDLVTDLKNADCETYKARDKASIKTILTILQDYEKCCADIEACWKNIKEMEYNVDKITQRLVEQKLKVQALYGRSMTVPQSEHRQRVLENRLYHVTTQFDTKVTSNKELREEINMMLKLRGIFFERMIRMKRQSNRIKRRMGEIVYLATQAYEQRDDWVAKIRILREKNEKDSKQHVLEIKEFNRALHNDSKLHAFMELKNMDRELMESIVQRNDRKNQTKVTEIDAMLKTYENSFRKILFMAKSDDIETIVNKYLEREQMNFARFKYITDINDEISTLRDQNIAMAKEIEDLYIETRANEAGRKSELADLMTTYDIENKSLDDLIDIWDNYQTQMQDVIILMDQIFTVANCPSAPVIQLLGNLKGINPRNAILCMKVVERRVDQLIFEKARYEIRKVVELEKGPIPKKAALTQPGPKSKQAGGPFLPKLTVTGRLEGEQEEEDEDKSFLERPIPYPVMRERILGKLALLTVSMPDKSAGGRESVIDSAAGSEESIMLNDAGKDRGSIKVKTDTAKTKSDPLNSPRKSITQQP